jgi:hypothetical protein
VRLAEQADKNQHTQADKNQHTDVSYESSPRLDRDEGAPSP